MPIVIRPATTGDIAAITDIYNEAGVGTTASYDLEPVTEDDRLRWLQEHQREDFPVLVAIEDDEVAGFAAYGRFRDKKGYDRTVEHSVYVHKDHRTGGIGRLLMTALIDRARGEGRHVMLGVLDGDNEASIAFHERLGFREVARMPQVGHKFGRWLDVVIVAKMLEQPAS